MRYIYIILCLTVLSCSVNKQEKNTGFDKNLSTIIKDIESEKKEFYSSNIFTILKQNTSTKSFTYIVSNKNGFLNTLEILPDSIPMYYNNYLESNNKLYIYHSERKSKSNKKIFLKIYQYGHSLDSCSFKYKYLEDNLEKWTECTFFDSDTYVSFNEVEYYFSMDNKDEFKKKEFFGY